MKNSDRKEKALWQHRLREILFSDRTQRGRWFDLCLLVVIMLSVLTVMAESVEAFRTAHKPGLAAAEWAFTILFTIEYGLRLFSARKMRRYAVSFFGIVDLLAVVPTYVGLLLPGTPSLLILRVLRMARVFRILKLGRYVQAGELIGSALKASRQKIMVFLFMVLCLVIIIGSLMYLVEGPENGFTSIPRSMYWGIVTLTTVGYGDISPQTALGQMLASLVMILGYSIIAVPTGIIGSEYHRARRHSRRPAVSCLECGAADHDADAHYCKYCGRALPEQAAIHH